MDDYTAAAATVIPTKPKQSTTQTRQTSNTLKQKQLTNNHNSASELSYTKKSTVVGSFICTHPHSCSSADYYACTLGRSFVMAVRLFVNSCR